LPFEAIQWIKKSTFEAMSPQEKDGLAIYAVHADPRSMKGSNEAMLKLWKKWRVDTGQLPTVSTSFTQLKNTDWESEGGMQRSQQVLVNETVLRQNHLSAATQRILDYAEFLLRAEAVGCDKSLPLTQAEMYSDKVTNRLGGKEKILLLATKRLNTSGAIAPDIDLLGVGVNINAVNDDSFQVEEGVGRITPVTKILLEQVTSQSENLKVQKAIHHGAEEYNFEFPQNLLDDYPIGIVSTNDTGIKIPRSESNHPHELLFKYLRDNPQMDTSINPAYIVKNAQEFPKNEKLWPAAQIKKMKVYENWINVGLRKDVKKQAYFRELKTQYDNFKDRFPFCE
ncbi:MAG: hypothetical protein OXE99_08090, partial [Cellvibrionales bacterium]|nr:hypothetical protein [Cellvibrionales bacterium]